MEEKEVLHSLLGLEQGTRRMTRGITRLAPEVLSCICTSDQSSHWDKRAQVQCTNCFTWVHAECYNVDPTSLIPNFACQHCSGSSQKPAKSVVFPDITGKLVEVDAVKSEDQTTAVPTSPPEKKVQVRGQKRQSKGFLQKMLYSHFTQKDRKRKPESSPEPARGASPVEHAASEHSDSESEDEAGRYDGDHGSSDGTENEHASDIDEMSFSDGDAVPMSLLTTSPEASRSPARVSAATVAALRLVPGLYESPTRAQLAPDAKKKSTSGKTANLSASNLVSPMPSWVDLAAGRKQQQEAGTSVEDDGSRDGTHAATVSTTSGSNGDTLDTDENSMMQTETTSSGQQQPDPQGTSVDTRTDDQQRAQEETRVEDEDSRDQQDSTAATTEDTIVDVVRVTPVMKREFSEMDFTFRRTTRALLRELGDQSSLQPSGLEVFPRKPVRKTNRDHKPTTRVPCAVEFRFLPVIYHRVIRSLTEEEVMRFDTWRTQNLILAATIDLERFKGADNTEDAVFEYILEQVRRDCAAPLPVSDDDSDDSVQVLSGSESSLSDFDMVMQVIEPPTAPLEQAIVTGKKRGRKPGSGKRQVAATDRGGSLSPAPVSIAPTTATESVPSLPYAPPAITVPRNLITKQFEESLTQPVRPSPVQSRESLLPPPPPQSALSVTTEDLTVTSSEKPSVTEQPAERFELQSVGDVGIDLVALQKQAKKLADKEQAKRDRQAKRLIRQAENKRIKQEEKMAKRIMSNPTPPSLDLFMSAPKLPETSTQLRPPGSNIAPCPVLPMEREHRAKKPKISPTTEQPPVALASPAKSPRKKASVASSVAPSTTPTSSISVNIHPPSVPPMLIPQFASSRPPALPRPVKTSSSLHTLAVPPSSPTVHLPSPSVVATTPGSVPPLLLGPLVKKPIYKSVDVKSEPSYHGSPSPLVRAPPPASVFMGAGPPSSSIPLRSVAIAIPRVLPTPAEISRTSQSQSRAQPLHARSDQPYRSLQPVPQQQGHIPPRQQSHAYPLSAQQQQSPQPLRQPSGSEMQQAFVSSVQPPPQQWPVHGHGSVKAERQVAMSLSQVRSTSSTQPQARSQPPPSWHTESSSRPPTSHNPNVFGRSTPNTAGQALALSQLKRPASPPQPPVNDWDYSVAPLSQSFVSSGGHASLDPPLARFGRPSEVQLPWQQPVQEHSLYFADKNEFPLEFHHPVAPAVAVGPQTHPTRGVRHGPAGPSGVRVKRIKPSPLMDVTPEMIMDRATHDRLHAQSVVASYNAFMQDPVVKQQRSWRTDVDSTPHWTQEDIARFADVYQRIGNGPTNNRKIAKELGKGFHPNHVARMKRLYHSVQKERDNDSSLDEDEDY